jgi:hypothetical protein
MSVSFSLSPFSFLFLWLGSRPRETLLDPALQLLTSALL